MGEKFNIHYLRSLDAFSKIAIVVLVSTITYVVLLFLLKPIFIPADSPLAHTSMMAGHMMVFQSPEQSNLNIAAIVGGILAGAVTSFFLGKKETPEPKKTPKEEHKDELAIIKRALSADEKKLLAVVEEAGEITQDSLVFRLGWNRSKVSVMVSHLERMNIVQRKREGKTYIVFLAKKQS